MHSDEFRHLGPMLCPLAQLAHRPIPRQPRQRPHSCRAISMRCPQGSTHSGKMKSSCRNTRGFETRLNGLPYAGRSQETMHKHNKRRLALSSIASSCWSSKSRQRALHWNHSEEYGPVKALRLRSATTHAFLLNGAEQAGTCERSNRNARSARAALSFSGRCHPVEEPGYTQQPSGCEHGEIGPLHHRLAGRRGKLPAEA